MLEEGCQTFHASPYDVPLELLDTDARQPTSRVEWETVLLNVMPLINRNTLFYTYVLLLCTGPLDVVPRRFVQRYVGFLNNRSGLHSDTVCEMLWSVPNISMPRWFDLAAAVGNPDCGDWSSYTQDTRERIAYTLESTKNQWGRFPFNVCEFTDRTAIRVQHRVCCSDASVCHFNRPHWCVVCDQNRLSPMDVVFLVMICFATLGAVVVITFFSLKALKK